MKNLRPYWFWIVAGLLILAGLILPFALEPTENGKTAAEAAKNLTTMHGRLKDLRARAEKDPIAVFNPMDRRDQDELLNKYLVTTRWIEMDPTIERYRAQRLIILEHLTKRSAPLAVDLTDKADPNEWKDAYEKETAKFLLSLFTAGRIVLPSAPANGPAPTDKDLKEKAEIRAVAGLETYTGEVASWTPRWPELRLKFRILQTLGSRIIPTTGTVKPNPVLDAQPRLSKEPVTTHASILQVTWKELSAKAADPELANIATITTLDLKLIGAPAALTASIAAIERNDEAQPVIAILGADLQRREDFKDKERLDIDFETATCNVQIAVINFSKGGARADNSSAAGRAPAGPRLPPGSYAPPGMPAGGPVLPRTAPEQAMPGQTMPGQTMPGQAMPGPATPGFAPPGPPSQIPPPGPGKPGGQP